MTWLHSELREYGDAFKLIQMLSDFLRAKRLMVAGCVWLLAHAAVVASESEIQESEALGLPTAARLSVIHESVRQHGWGSQREELRMAARRAFTADKLPVAAAWLRLYQWATLLSRTEKEFVLSWLDSIKRTDAGHSGMASQYRLGPERLGDAFSPECLAWIIRRDDFSEQFFGLVQPVDYLPRVFQIINELYRHDPAKFEKYPSLVLAIAVVYDVPPPPDWPHGQVSAAELKRAWSDPVEVFDWFTEQDRLGRTQYSLRQLRADELKFVVDIATPFKELEWAQTNVNLPLLQLERSYSMIRYREERLTKNEWAWTEKDYTLQTILATGGICVDQAYFASAVGKARGVPTLFFHGVGDNGRHAWFGFLGANQQWHFNAGRYAEQQFVTGYARDPQTWNMISDHDLELMAERLRSSPAFRNSQVLTQFAGDFLASGEAPAASRAARKAVNYERRNQPAWEILLAAESKLGIDPKLREATLREAMLAFAHYPDLEVFYSKRLSENLRNRGEASAADFEQRRITQKFALERADLGLRNAREAVWRKNGGDPVAQLIQNYNATLDRMGPGAGIAFFDEIVVPVVEYLAEQKKLGDAERAIERARRTLRVEPKSQLEQEFAAVTEKLKTLRK